MPIIINRKICDNFIECPAIAECPTGALYFDKEKELLSFDKEKCIDCFKCVDCCDINTLRPYKTEDEKKDIIDEINSLKITQEELFSDRYGAVAIDNNVLMEEGEFLRFIENSNDKLIVEFFDEDIAECLYKSIPVKDIVSFLGNEYKYIKVNVIENKIRESYSLNTIPSLIIFDDGNVSKKIEGYYSSDEMEEFINKLK